MSEQFGLEILKNYGIAGFIIVVVLLFAGWIIRKILTHFMEAVTRKDEQIITLSNRFTDALERNTRAISELTQSEQRLAIACENNIDATDRFAEQNRQEHTYIIGELSKFGSTLKEATG